MCVVDQALMNKPKRAPRPNVARVTFETTPEFKREIEYAAMRAGCLSVAAWIVLKLGDAIPPRACAKCGGRGWEMGEPRDGLMQTADCSACGGKGY